MASKLINFLLSLKRKIIMYLIARDSINKTCTLVPKSFAEKNEAQIPYNKLQFQNVSLIVVSSPFELMYVRYGLQRH